jgi:hypothetical protein
MIYYLHIPKTGGQTLATRIAAAFPRDRSWILQGDIRSPNQLRDLLREHDFIEGHASVGTLRGLDPAVDLMCTVRDPIAHVRSLFAHILREPRLRLHPPARALGFRGFAQHYGDHLFNMQAGSLVQVFESRDLGYYREGHELWTLDRLAAAVRRVRWLVPTEQIDDFCLWWPIETGRPAVPGGSRVNVAAAAEQDDEVTAFVRENPHRLSLDYALWAMARQRYDAWRSAVAVAAAPPPDERHASCAFSDGQGHGIWLERGWYSRALRGDGMAEWWAGPAAISELRVRRSPDQLRLSFEVPALIGFRHEGINLFAANSAKRLPVRMAPVGDGPIMAMSFTLPPDLGIDIRLQIQVPRAASFLEVSPPSGDGQRRSFATQNWSLGTAG